MADRERTREEPFPTSDVFETAAREAERALRERAQREALTRPDSRPEQGAGLGPDAASKLLHELRVHQVELEMQNEELRRAQLEIEASRSRYFELYDLAPVGYLTIAEKGLVLEANLTVAGMLGLARGELVQQPWTRFILADDQDTYFNFRKRLLARGEPQQCEIRLLKKGGSPFWAHFEARLARGSEETAELRLALSDISERRRMETTLRVSEARHRVLFESSPDALMTLAPPSWRFNSGNPAAVALFGARDEADFTSHTLWEYSPARQLNGHASRDDALSAIEQAMQGGSRSLEWTCARASGEEFSATVVLSRLELEGVPLLQATVRDESGAKRRRASAAQTERLSSMGMLAASVGHEINNPLSYLLSNLEILVSSLQRLESVHERAVDPAPTAEPTGGARGPQAPVTVEEMQTRASHAVDGARRVARIARVLNTFARAEKSDLSATDLARAIESALALAFNEIRFRGELVKEFGVVPRVWASEGRLSQVFLNLLVNASHAMEGLEPGDGRITIRTWAEDGHVLAEVIDTGKGIAQQDLARIFEPFFSTKQIGVGTGLGLPICRNILAEIGGEIRVESELGKGTRFVVRVPAWTAGSPAAAEIGSEAPLPAVRGRILVVDDEELLLLTMKRLLAEHEVVTASSGRAARALLERDQAFDLVICDLMMPDFTGIDLHRWLVTQNPTLAEQLVFVSGGAFGPVSTEYLAHCSNLRIDKPFDAGVLRRTVSEGVRRAQSQRESRP